MKINTKQIAVMQVLPHLNSGGLVSGAVEIAKELVHSNFKSLIVSSKALGSGFLYGKLSDPTKAEK